MKRQIGLLLLLAILSIISLTEDATITGQSIAEDTALADTPGNRAIVKYLIITAMVLFIIVLILIMSLILQNDDEKPMPEKIHKMNSARLNRIRKIRKELDAIHTITNS